MIIVQTKSFKKDSAKTKMSDKHFTKLVEYLYFLSKEETLPKEALDHQLKGEWIAFREFHISGDLLVIYRVYDEIVELVRIGSHNQLFKK